MIKLALVKLIFCLILSNAYSNDLVSDGKTVSYKKGLFGLSTIKADYYSTATNSPTGVLLIAPGGGINAYNMRGLARAAKLRDYLVFVIHYKINYPAVPGQGDNPIEFANLLRNNISKISGLNESQSNQIRSVNNIYILAHSLGGSVLGKASGDKNSPVDKMFFYGVDSMVRQPSEPTVPVELFFGEHDKLMSESKVEKLSSFYKTKPIVVPELNHFCIITDADAGVKMLRNKDGKTHLNNDQCINQLLDFMNL